MMNTSNAASICLLALIVASGLFTSNAQQPVPRNSLTSNWKWTESEVLFGNDNTRNALISSNGLFMLGLSPNGQLRLVGPKGQQLWLSDKVSQSAGCTLVVQADGSAIIYCPKNGGQEALWSTNTWQVGSPQYKLTLRDDGNLVLTDSRQQTTWQTNTAQPQSVIDEAIRRRSLPGSSLTSDPKRGLNFIASDGVLLSNNELYSFVMQGDSNIVLYKKTAPAAAPTPSWATGRLIMNNGQRAAAYPFTLTLQEGGDLVATDKSGRQLWSTKSGTGKENGPYTLSVLDSGKVVIYNNRLKPTWEISA